MGESTDTPDSLEARLRETAAQMVYAWPQHRQTADLIQEAVVALEALRAELYRAPLGEPAAQQQERVPLPKSENAAAMMALVGISWLKEHAPDRLSVEFRSLSRLAAGEPNDR